MEQLLGHAPRPTVVFCLANVLTIGALRALNAAHLAVPGDMSIAGFDDFPCAELLGNGISVAKQAVSDIARECLTRATSGDVAADIVIPAEVVWRGSISKPLPK